MKITAVRSFPVKSGHRNVFIVKVETDEGISGLGEGGISGRELAMEGMIRHYERELVGQDPRRVEHLWQLLYRGNYFEGGNIASAALSAIDIALHDIKAKWLNIPVYELLGGAVRDHCPLFATGASLRSERAVESAKELVAAGWKDIRFTTGMGDEGWTGGDGSVYEPMESVALAAHWIREVRRAVGPAIRLSIDFHHRLQVAEAAVFLQMTSDVGLYFIEEPIRAESPAAYKQLRTMTPVPFAIGEEFPSKWAFAPYIEEGILNFARIDISNVGGLSEARKVAGWCETRYIDVMPHNPLGPVTTAASVHFGIATSNFAQLELQHGLQAGYNRELFPKLMELDGTVFPLPTGPGLGVEFNEDAVADNPFEMWNAPHWYRRDGQKTNW
ncbi:MAG TPA: mandelate racemase/muconate lactonizing enzyme family protein [Thermomicrobiales bacterium]|nr:mandelate racemase/muconate lactonizing enzyme family protein [Thermomicrobiales bacterium]